MMDLCVGLFLLLLVVGCWWIWIWIVGLTTIRQLSSQIDSCSIHTCRSHIINWIQIEKRSHQPTKYLTFLFYEHSRSIHRHIPQINFIRIYIFFFVMYLIFAFVQLISAELWWTFRWNESMYKKGWVFLII